MGSGVLAMPTSQFAFMNSFVNPLVGWLLRSPLHSMLSASLMLITVRGRKSGNSYTLPVQYAQTPEAIYVVPGDAEHKTWLSISQ